MLYFWLRQLFFTKLRFVWWWCFVGLLWSLFNLKNDSTFHVTQIYFKMFHADFNFLLFHFILTPKILYLFACHRQCCPISKRGKLVTSLCIINWGIVLFHCIQIQHDGKSWRINKENKWTCLHSFSLILFTSLRTHNPVELNF